MKATPKQKQLIHINAYNRELKEEYVQWATGDTSKTSCNDLSFVQANKIIALLGKQPVQAKKDDTPLFWGYFSKTNKQHKQIQCLLHQIKWTKYSIKYGRIPDLARFGSWLQSAKSPVKKPLKKMTTVECSKIIIALNGILKSKYK